MVGVLARVQQLAPRGWVAWGRIGQRPADTVGGLDVASNDRCEVGGGHNVCQCQPVGSRPVQPQDVTARSGGFRVRIAGRCPTPQAVDQATGHRLPPVTVETPDAEYHYTFNGQIHPERYSLHVGKPIMYQYDRLMLVVWLVRGQVAVDVVAREEWSSVIDLKNLVMSVVESVVNALGFALAAAFRTEIVSYRGPSGDLEVFNTAFDGLRSGDGDSPTPDEEVDFDTLRTTAALHPAIRAALSDLAEAMRAPSDTFFYCYRAVEAIRQHYVPENVGIRDGREVSWKAMRAALNVLKSELDWLTPLATSSRHGELLSVVTEDDRRRALRLARRIVLAHARIVEASTEPASSGDAPGPRALGDDRFRL